MESFSSEWVRFFSLFSSKCLNASIKLQEHCVLEYPLLWQWKHFPGIWKNWILVSLNRKLRSFILDFLNCVILILTNKRVISISVSKELWILYLILLLTLKNTWELYSIFLRFITLIFNFITEQQQQKIISTMILASFVGALLWKSFRLL